MMTAETEPHVTYTVGEVKARLGCSKSTVHVRCKSGQLRAEKRAATPDVLARGGPLYRWAIDAESVASMERIVHLPKAPKPPRVRSLPPPRWHCYPGRGTTRKTPRPYLDAVCQVYALTEACVLGRSREPFAMEARRVLSYLLYVDAGHTMASVARLTRRDHSTALNAISQATEHPSEEVTWAIAECRAVVAKRRAERARKAS